ncbi:Beta-N-acetylhexosaminidase [Xylanimonas cellulosilytica DSM 15894]|uniref:beta-N-acetylhexosaminidase n=1 Tax=Xylanimonas cellulosilytica (strain DSM 15894 / JCM 12276 / CECT 5975 / KCTC 9989 / LMG 20990 / NBRC 107835 / XIL07) TaxID=446471 RepID=D1BTY7_XYLCX|nr:glycoside hydrolase family 3 N-terminal domain-containing protein [Xylanimonas cellulosilytica]ACZ29151.1 Beta-N-acetylhexosaminidase [Xylanimonas cellulosilytica DSM 15894]
MPRARSRTATAVAAMGLAVVGMLASCAGGGAATPSPAPPVTASPSPSPSPTAPPAPSPSPSSSPTTTPAPSPTPSEADPIAGWTLEQKVGRLLMVGRPLDGDSDLTARLVAERHVGGVFLHGRSHEPVEQVRAIVDPLRTLATDPPGLLVATDPPGLLVATDQEGGRVQVLQGPGFDAMPSAVEQLGLPDLRAQAAGWGAQLAAAGVDVNLGPVADLVPADIGAANPPIGAFDRNYGSTAAEVVAGAGAFAAGMQDAGVVPTLKHFPGLGRVTANTDTSADVVDAVTTADDASVGVFRDVLAASSAEPRPWVMMSTAVYGLIDPERPAAFSPTVVGLLRDRLGFDGVVITDDVSAAAQVQAWSPGDRAVLAIDAGVDVVLASADPTVADEMLDALLARAESDPAFATKVDDAARRLTR